MREVFDYSKYNVIEDNENYYFFRALNNGDYSDILSGATIEDGKIRRIRTDLQRYKDLPLYREDDQISLEEVHDHVKWRHRRDTNCISLSMNANVVATYGRTDYHDQYAVITIPKNKINNDETSFYLAGKFLLEEIKNRINDLINRGFISKEKVECINDIRNVNNNEELFRVLDNFSKLPANNYKLKKNNYYDYYALNEEQNLEKNKIIAEMEIINRRLLTRCSNRLLIESIKFAFTSSEVIHYKSIEKDFNYASATTIDLFSLLQQALSLGLDKEKIKRIELKVISCMKENMTLENGRYGNYNSKINDYSISKNNIKISDIYNITNGQIPYYKASKALEFLQEIANSKIRTSDLCELLKEIINEEDLNSIIDEIKEKCYVIPKSFISRNLQQGLRLSDSVFLSINEDKDKIFSAEEQKSLLNYINSLNYIDKKDFINQKEVMHEKELCDLLIPTYRDNVSLNKYYAETILDYLDLDKIYENSYLEKKLTIEEKNIIISLLEKANCQNMFESLNELGIDAPNISGIIFNLMLSNGYQGLNFIDLSNLNTFKELIKENITNVDSKVSALRLDYVLGIRDNDNHIPTTNITLRDYQQLAVDKIDKLFETKNYAGVVLPTGAGKSFVAIAEMLKYSDKNILYYAPNKEILRQLQKHIVEHALGLNIIPESEELYLREHPELIMKGFVFESDINDLIGASFPYFKMYCYQGLTTKEDEFFQTRNAGLIVLDEVHRTGAKEWNERIKLLLKNNPNSKILGITATPVRDVDNQNMIDKLAELCGTYTREEIKMKQHIASELYLVDAMQEGIVVTPKIVTFDYTLEDSEQYKEVKKMYETEKNQNKKEKLKNIYESMRKIINTSKNKGMPTIFKEGFENNYKPFNGRYIVFLPPNPNGQIPTEEYMLSEIEKVKQFFKEIDPNPEVEYLLSNRTSKSENARAISRFENDSNHLKLIFAINMLNEGVHVKGIDGVIMLRPLGAGNKILYHQQIGRCIYSLDPNHELELSEFPIIFDVYNNYLEQNMDRQVNRHTITSDLQKLYMIKEWINKHFRYPDINSESINEARKAITLKRIQKKYYKYLDNEEASFHLTEEEVFEIRNIIELGNSIDLWDIEIPDRTIDPKEHDIEHFATFELKGEQKEFINLFREASKITSDNSISSRKLRLIDTLNILDILSEYNVEIDNESIPIDSILGNVYSKIPDDILKLIKEEVPLDYDFRIGREYNEVKKQFYKKNLIFEDYDIKILRKMGVFEPCNLYKGFENVNIIDEKGFIINGPSKFINLNIYTGTYFGPDGLNIIGLDEHNFSVFDGFFNKYNFGRDGYYYEQTDEGFVKTNSIYNPNGFDINGYYHELQEDGTYKQIGKINRHGFDIDGFYYKYNNITKEYVKTNYLYDERGFNIDGIYCATGDVEARNTRRIKFVDGKEIIINNISYATKEIKRNRFSKFITDLPYDFYYFDIDGYYYGLDENNNRVKTNSTINERGFDAYGNYYRLQEDGTRIITNNKYDDNFFDIDGYYYELQEDGTRKKTNSYINENGVNCLGYIVKYQKNKIYSAFDKDGYCYEYKNGLYKKIEPQTKINKYGFDINGYYHELLEDGTRNEIPSDSKLDKHGFNECGICIIDGKKSIVNKNNFNQEGYYCEFYFGQLTATMKTNPYGFDIDGLFDFILPDGTTIKKCYNNRFLSMDGYYYKRDKDTKKRVKTDRRVDARGFDLEGNHFDVLINTLTGERVYTNKSEYDKYGFDVNGIYYEYPTITSSKTNIKRRVSNKRVKTNPPRMIDERMFNYKGNYCEMKDGKLIETDSKYNLYGFDRDGYYIEVGVNGEKTTIDKYGFDVDGYYDSEHKIKNDDKGFTQKDYYNFEHKNNDFFKSRFDPGLNYHDEEGKVIGKIDKHGFDFYGYYHELQEDGTRNEKSTGSIYNPRGFDINGIYHGKLLDGSDPIYTMHVDARGFDIDGFYITNLLDEKKEKKNYVNTYNFDFEGYYHETIDLDENGNLIKSNIKCDKYGFDIDGYYHELLEDGTRSKKSTGSIYNPRGFDRDKKYHKLLKNGEIGTIGFNQDDRGFDIDGIFVLDNKGNPYDTRFFDADGFLYKLSEEKGIYEKTNMVYDSNYFDVDGYYYELQENGIRKKTDSKYNPDGYDLHNFNKNGIHKVTGLNYDENYFKQDGINIITNTRYSVKGYDIDNGFYEKHISRFMTKKRTESETGSLKYIDPLEFDDYTRKSDHGEELDCVYIARKALELPISKRDLSLNNIISGSRNKNELLKTLYTNIVAAAVIDSNIKDLLIKYVKKLSDEIKYLMDELKIEKTKTTNNSEIIKDLEKKIKDYKDMYNKINIR